MFASSALLSIDGEIVNFNDLRYDTDADEDEATGCSPLPLGRTVGVYSASCSITINAASWHRRSKLARIPSWRRRLAARSFKGYFRRTA